MPRFASSDALQTFMWRSAVMSDRELPKTRKDAHLGFVEQTASGLLHPFVDGDITFSGHITEGPNDTGLDAVALVIDGKLIATQDDLDHALRHITDAQCHLFLIQITTSTRLKKQKVKTFIEGAFDFLENDRNIPANHRVTRQSDLKDTFLDRLRKAGALPPTVSMFYAHMGVNQASDDIRPIFDEALRTFNHSDAFNQINFNCFDSRAITAQMEALHRRRTTTVPNEDLKPIAGGQNCFQGTIRLSDLLRIIALPDRDTFAVDSSRFFENVRNNIGYDSSVQQGLRETLTSPKSDDLHILHSGIKIVCNKVSRQAGQLLLKDYQIVDGCQTCMAVADVHDQLHAPESRLPVTIIATVNPEKRQRIILTSNTHAKVTEEQLLSLYPFNAQIHWHFEAMRASGNGPNLFYEYRKGMEVAELDHGTDQDTIPALNLSQPAVIKPYDLYKAFAAMFHQWPHTASDGIARLKPRMHSDLETEPQKAVLAYYCAGVANFHWSKALGAHVIPEKHSLFRYPYLAALAVLHRVTATKTIFGDRDKIADRALKAMQSEDERQAMFKRIAKAIDATIKAGNRWSYDKATSTDLEFYETVCGRLLTGPISATQ